MVNTKDRLQNVLKKMLKDSGYLKKGSAWHLNNKDIICVLNLQKSQWGEQFYINLGLYLKKFGDQKYPKVYDCHVESRLESIISDDGKLHKSLDFESKGNIDKKLFFIKKSIEDNVLPLFASFNTFEDVKNFVKRNPKKFLVIHEVLKN